jgi:hypothetical protein
VLQLPVPCVALLGPKRCILGRSFGTMAAHRPGASREFLCGNSNSLGTVQLLGDMQLYAVCVLAAFASARPRVSVELAGVKL